MFYFGPPRFRSFPRRDNCLHPGNQTRLVDFHLNAAAARPIKSDATRLLEQAAPTHTL